MPTSCLQIGISDGFSEQRDNGGAVVRARLSVREAGTTLLDQHSQQNDLTMEGLQLLSQRFDLIQIRVETVFAPSFWIGFGRSERRRSGF